MRRRKKNMQETLKWLFPPVLPGEMESAGDRVLERIRREMPGQVEAFRFWPDIVCQATSLGQFERFVLTAVDLLGDEANGLRIRDKVGELGPKRANIGAVYVCAERLEAQGLLVFENRLIDDGHPHRFYKLTEKGERVLALLPYAAEAAEKSEDFA